MIFRAPSYYKNFKCTADKCTDNCCIGWEIEIDSNTADYYKNVGGDFGKRLAENISPDNSFVLKNERCPFLNKDNLCDIIINCGEDRLCQICRDHPRFFEWYGDIKEGGIGLSCEEGARLILTSDDVSYDESEVDEENEEVDGELFEMLVCARGKIFSIIDDTEKAVSEKLCNLLDYAERLQFTIDNYGTEIEFCEVLAQQEFADALKSTMELFSGFEPIDDSWTREITIILSECCTEKLKIKNEKEEKFILNLCRYFIWRYFLKGVFSEEILSKVKFAVVSVMMIKIMTDGDDTLSRWIEKSKLYSKQMEYSDENRELFYDSCYVKKCLSVSQIKGIIKETF